MDEDERPRTSQPESYRSHSARERLLLWMAGNFRRQHAARFPLRRPPLLAARNECGVDKLVCTTIRPTQLPFPELFNWQGCAGFVADHVTYRPLDRPFDPPSRLCSPEKVLRDREAHCFELSTLLASLLIGVGYDAYVASGYAVVQLCEGDRSCEAFPPEDADGEQEIPPTPGLGERGEEEEEEEEEFRSKYLEFLEGEASGSALDRAKRSEEDRLLRPPDDPFLGHRVHSWVLVLPGKREVPEAFFVEPSTGERAELGDDRYLQLESLWNDRNYWVNKREELDLDELFFDLNDTESWEYLLVNDTFPYNSHENEPHGVFTLPPDEDEREWLPRNYPRMPPSWVRRLDVSREAYDLRFPGGEKTVLFQRAKVTRRSPYANAEGLVKEVVRYSDPFWERPVQTVRTYAHRQDRLVRRTIDPEGTARDRFARGRPDLLLEFVHPEPPTQPGAHLKMTYLSSVCPRGLKTREVTSTTMTEAYEDRKDDLLERTVLYEERKTRIRFDDEAPERKVVFVEERYARNTSRRPEEDAQRITFDLRQGTIRVVYFRRDEYLSCDQVTFQKPPVGERGETEGWVADLVSVYACGAAGREASPQALFEMFSQLVDRESRTVDKIHEAEEEVKRLLELREEEDANPQLVVSTYDCLRNASLLREDEKGQWRLGP